MAHVAEYKKQVVNEFVDLMNSYPIVGAVNMENMPAAQLQKMRALLRESVVLRMTKRKLINKVIEQVKGKKQGIEKLSEHLKGMPALLFTKDNPFKLYNTIQKNKSKAPAKGGQIAPNDIIVNAGATSFAPGPIIGELGSIGLKTGVENGKVTIREDKIVVKAGEVIKPKTAEILTRLGIEPMEIGLDLVATFEHGVIYTKDVLAIDEVKFMSDLTTAAQWAFNLSVESAYPVKDNIELLVSKAFTDAKGLAVEQNILADAVVEDILAKAERQMLALKDTAKIEVNVNKRIEVKEKAEEIKQEAEEVRETAEEVAADVVEQPDVKEEVQAFKETIQEKAEEIIEKAEEIEKKVDVAEISKIEKEETELKAEADKLRDDVQEVKAVQERKIVEKLKEDAAKLDKVKDKLDKQAKPLAENLIKEEKQIEKELDNTEKLFEELKKKGTLRNVPLEPKLGSVKTKKEAKKEDVPSAHELAKKLKKK